MSVQATVCQLGYTNPLTGAFGSHPVLGAVLDLNDGQLYSLASPAGVDLSAPIRTLVSAGNIRSPGEAGLRAIYRHNREARLQLILGPGSSYASFITSVRALLRWLSAPPQLGVTLKYQPMTATAPVYLDVVAAAHTLPSNEDQWLRLQLEPIELLLVVRPGLRGDRVTLQNLVVNPGFEAPYGGGTATAPTTVFADTFANANAYSTLFGGAPTVGGSILTIPGATALQFGSPAWGAIAQWRVRFQIPGAGGFNPQFLLHYTDFNDTLGADLTSTALRLIHTVGGTLHVQASTPITPGAGTWYWLSLTQFPSVAGDPPYLSVTLSNDAAGSLGTSVASISAPAFDAASAQLGKSVIYNNSVNAMQVGGASASGVHTVALFGPGSWSFSGTNGTSGLCSGAWDGTRSELGMSGTATPGTQTYAGGPLTSFGALRIDLAPAGTIGTYAYTYLGGPDVYKTAIPVASSGDVLGVSCFVKSSGLSATATIKLLVYEYDASGTSLRNTLLQTLTGNQAAWTALAGTLATGASTAYAGVLLLISDSSGSNGATVWIDNVQAWDQTTTGATSTSMPYCELRFANSPAQLVVSGLQGDLPTPAAVAIGSYLTSLPTGGALNLALARAGRHNPNAQLTGTSAGWYGSSGFTPQASATADATSYNGFYPSATTTSSGWNPRAFSLHPADALGVYALFVRFLTKQTAGNLPNVQVRQLAQQLSDAWYGLSSGTDQLGTASGPWLAPLSGSNTWQAVNAGQVSIPPLAAAALTDLSQTFVIPRPQWVDATAGGSLCQANWQALLPLDGSLLLALLNNPSNAPFALANQWLWMYFDGLLAASGPQGVASSTTAWTYSVESTALPKAARGGGGPGTQSSGTINLNSAADPYLTLDPLIGAPSQGANQLVGIISDSSGAVLPLHVEMIYTPLYLWPR